MNGDMSLMSFLEDVVREVLEEKPEKIAVVRTSADGGVVIAYRKCGYDSLQRFGQELINEGTVMVVAANKERIQELRDEYEAQEEPPE